MKPIILASSSLARRMLLERLALPFQTIAPDIDESELPEEAPMNLVARLTKQKAKAVASNFPNSLVISADQVIVVQGQAISKPENKKTAIQQLMKQSGAWVTAYSGLGLLNTQTQHYQYACVATQVQFQTLTLARIEEYLAKEPTAIYCAGSLRVESLGISLLSTIHSDDPTALIGLPLIALCAMLREEGVQV